MKLNIEYINFFFIQYGQKGHTGEETLEGVKQFFFEKYNII